MTPMAMPSEQSQRDLDTIRGIARDAALALEGPSDAWIFRPAIEFGMKAEPYIERTSGELRLCLAFLCLTIRDVMQNLAGDVPYDALGERLDVARSDVQRALRAALRDLAADLHQQNRPQATIESCSALAAEYLAAISRLNRLGD
jgi:hypothetical protein